MLEQISKTVLPHEESTIEIDITALIPIYQGPIEVEMNMESTPIFDFEADSITAEMKASKTFSVEATMILIPWKIIGAIIAVLIILLIISSRFTKKNAKPVAARKPRRRTTAKTATKKTTKTPAKKAATKKTTTKRPPRKK